MHLMVALLLAVWWGGLGWSVGSGKVSLPGAADEVQTMDGGSGFPPPENP